jgi:hypothetical protein
MEINGKDIPCCDEFLGLTYGQMVDKLSGEIPHDEG